MQATSGVTVNDECKTEFVNFKMHSKYKYIVFRLSDDLKEVIIDKCGPPGTWYTYEREILSFWWHFRHCLHRKLPLQPVAKFRHNDGISVSVIQNTVYLTV